MTRLTLFKKILIATLLLSLIPLLASSLILFFNLESVNTRLSTETADSADEQASESLQMRAQHVAETIADFLRQCESDLLFLSSTTDNSKILLDFYTSRRGDVWERRGTAAAPRETREMIPLYRSVAVIDRSGRERILIRDGIIMPGSTLRNVSDPINTEFKSEEYFRRTIDLGKGEVYVSHTTGFHVTKQEQLAGASDPESAFDSKPFQGVIRFSTPLFDKSGRTSGILVLSLDHRHLMEFTQHIDPGRNFSTIFPSYGSGNYAFIFDDEGWIITHPKYWDIRGFDAGGKLIPPYTAQSSPTDIDTGRIPFNLDHAGFIHPNYPRVAEAVRRQQVGHVDITNVGGSKKIMAYAPIRYSTGDYRKYGVFGGVTIGFQVDQFHDAARKGSRLITSQLGHHRTRSAVILMLTALLASLTAWVLSRSITRPLRDLNESVRRLAEGDSRNRVAVTSTDEVGELAGAFNNMVDELENRKTSLLATLNELRSSRLEIMDERNFKESILESISSAIVTFSNEGSLTSINGTGRKYLGLTMAIGKLYREVFDGWGDMVERIERSLREKNGYGRDFLRIERDGAALYFDIGIFPVGRNAEQGLTVTMRNETEREKLREEMTRLDRLASLGKLSAGIAHEVRNPLTGISLLLDDLHDKSESGSDEQIMIKKAASEIDRVERLINALLNYSAPPRTELRECDLNRVINDTVLLSHRQCKKLGVRIVLELGETPVFRFDPEKIKQALLNILRNALDAMPDGGLMTISTTIASGQVAISIADNGVGISTGDLHQVFEPFFTRKGAGTGLGLSITQRIVEEHHGHIRVESNTGEGTVFIIELPIVSQPNPVSSFDY